MYKTCKGSEYVSSLVTCKLKVWSKGWFYWQVGADVHTAVAIKMTTYPLNKN